MQQDRVMCIKGTLRLALYDDRADSPTRGTVNVLHLSDMRPQLVFIPPNIWHGFQNLLNEVSTALVHVDRLYRHEDPDSWKLPHDSSQIPYQFQPR
jgi:dTDP-4-dehydrorhamnose 3,5-epimerase